jgi:hypothetical protein
MRLVVILPREPVSPDRIHSLLWEQSVAPFAEGQSEAAERHVRPTCQSLLAHDHLGEFGIFSLALPTNIVMNELLPRCTPALIHRLPLRQASTPYIQGVPQPHALGGR